MLVQQVVMPGSRRRSWGTVLGPDGVPVEPVERYLAFLTDVDRSPNTVKAYTHDLAPPVPASSRSRPARVGGSCLPRVMTSFTRALTRSPGRVPADSRRSQRAKTDVSAGQRTSGGHTDLPFPKPQVAGSNPAGGTAFTR